NPESIKLSVDAENLSNANVSVITVEVTDKKGLHVPTANNEITFSIKGAKILGVGNGDPTSLEKDQFIDSINLVPITNFEEKHFSGDVVSQSALNDNKEWKEAFKDRDYKNQASAYIYRGKFDFKNNLQSNIVDFFYKKIGVNESVFVNGTLVNASTDDPQKYHLDRAVLKEGTNFIIIRASPLQKVKDWDVMNTDPGIIRVITPAESWKRKLFNGYAQIIIQKDENANEVVLSASAKGLKSGVLNINVKK
ncbi:MAG: beta-galactosidase, partial [Flavobacterium sp.]